MWWLAWIGGYVALGMLTTVSFVLLDKKQPVAGDETRTVACAFMGLLWPLTWILFLALWAGMSAIELRKRVEKARTDAKDAN